MKQNRKNLLHIAVMALLPLITAAQFKLAPLPYATDALEPYIDKTTMEIHHGRHHNGYVKKLNAQIAANTALAGMSLEEIQQNVAKFGTAVRNNGGGHFNHSLFWQVMAPAGRGGRPSEALLKAINTAFGSMDQMKSSFNEAAGTRFGSGWAWLIVSSDKQLKITSTPNQDNPLMNLPEIEQGTPILGLDVWEHAYYLKYQNKRGEYVGNWWNVVNWNEVNRRFAAAVK
jgi:superoxide dismutase, Fe-Mn family